MNSSFKISSFSIILVFVILTIVGLALIPELSIKLAPSQSLPQINISFSMPNNAPRVIEMEVTSKLESMISRMSGVEKISSNSGNGWGNIQIRLNKHVDIEAARFEASTIIRQAWNSLPAGVSYPTISVGRSDNKANRPFISYTINAPSNPVLIQRFTEEQIKPKLAQIKGINRIVVGGATPMQWQIEYDYDQLQALEISIQDIQNAIDNYLAKEFLGILPTLSLDSTEKWIRVSLSSYEAQKEKPDLSQVFVKNIEGKLIKLSDISSINHIEAQPQSYYRINGLNSIYMLITADEDANQLRLAKKIATELSNIQESFPVGYELYRNYDATEYIKDELNKIYFRCGLTLFILLLFVLLTYRNIKYTLLIIISLFANVAIAVIFYYLLGVEMQLYSLAGITISLTLIIDNTIVMSDQIIRQGNKKAFTAILMATMTTIAALAIIFFLEEKIRLNLLDFAIVIIINLTLSLFIALFLVPALLEKLGIHTQTSTEKKKNPERRRKRIFPTRFKAHFNHFYIHLCRIFWKRRALVIIVVILSFGLPVFLLPEQVEGDKTGSRLYNKTLGSDFYKEKLKTYVDAALGGTLRLFVEKVYNGSYFSDRGEETTLYVTATLPNGATITQMNELIKRMESYISQFSEVKQFQTNIENARRASINILFTKENQQSSFPYLLKSKLISKSLELGGGSWGVYGLGDGFSNDVRETAGSYQAEMFGYNYDELLFWTEAFKEKLLKNRRIKEITVDSEFSLFKDDYQEFRFEINKTSLAQQKIQPAQLFMELKSIFGQNIDIEELAGENGLEKIVLQSRQSQKYNLWDLNNIPLTINNRQYKLSELAFISKEQAPRKIAKENQQYRLCLQYEYIGAYEQGQNMLEESIEEFQEELPMGYTVKNASNFNWWGKENNKQYRLLLLIFVIIFFNTSILFNSLKQPLYIIFIIPISYIGIFLTFYLFGLNFDQGGFAAFVLLSGLTVNANIYIVNEYNNIMRVQTIPPMKAYIKAWNAKIRPIFLTTVSTILGFIPFMIGNKEGFWFPLAAGTIGGLIVSFIATFCLLPLLMGVAKEQK